MSKHNAAYATPIDHEMFDDCQDELPCDRSRGHQDRSYCDGFECEVERITALSAPWNNALVMLRAAIVARDLPALQAAFEEASDVAKMFGRIDTIASSAERRIAQWRRREPRTR